MKPPRPHLASHPVPQHRPIQYVAAPPQSSGGPIMAGWFLLLIGVGIAVIPGGGFLVWLIALPLCIAAFALGIAGAAKGKAVAGVMLIMASMTLGPLALIVVPIFSVAVSNQAKIQSSKANEEINNR